MLHVLGHRWWYALLSTTQEPNHINARLELYPTQDMSSSEYIRDSIMPSGQIIQSQSCMGCNHYQQLCYLISRLGSVQRWAIDRLTGV